MEIEATSCSMLSGVGRNDSNAWQHFYDRYKVLVYMCGRRFGFSPVDLDDLLSRVMSKCFSTSDGNGGRAILSYDRSKGRFRDYFCRIISNEALTMLREAKRRREVPTESSDGKEFDIADESAEASTQKEYRLCLLHEAFQQVKRELPSRQIQAFIAARMDGVSPKRISRMQNVSLATVYNDITAVTDALRRVVLQLEDE